MVNLVNTTELYCAKYFTLTITNSIRLPRPFLSDIKIVPYGQTAILRKVGCRCVCCAICVYESRDSNAFHIETMSYFLVT